MRFFSYRHKKQIKAILLWTLLILGILILLICARFLFLQRYLVFSEDRVELNYEQQLASQGDPKPALNPKDYPLQMILPQDGAAVSGPVDDSMKQLSGYYISTRMLQDPESVQEALSDLETKPDTVMFEMKSIFGNFYYASSLFEQYTANSDIPAIETILEELKKDKVYLIAKVPAFSDNNFALDNQASGLPLKSGALWMDDNGCYWLDPLDADVQDFLGAVAAELSELGFDEIVFDGFAMPDSERIVYDTEKSRDEYTADAAQQLKVALSELPVRISFGSSSPLVAPHADRMYLSGVEGGSVTAIAETLSEHMEDPTAQIVFLTPSRDTRFEKFSVLRPLIEETGA